MLDFSGYDNGDSPELVAFKKKLRAVAKKYTDRHGWCEQVDYALKEIGAEPVNATAKVEVAILDVMTFVLEIEIDQYKNLSEEEQMTKLAEYINTFVVDSPKVKEFKVTPEAITATLLPPPPKPPEMPSVGGHEACYTSIDGRVLHLVLPNVERWRSYASYAACGLSGYYWSTHSHRSENRVCGRCAKSLDLSEEQIRDIEAASAAIA